VGLDLFNLPRGFRGDVQWFMHPTGSGVYEAQWKKPKGVSMVFVMAIGAGGGGGGGFTGIAGSARGGGGGGGSGGICTVLVPALLIPDTLYVTTHPGGAGGAAGVAGSSSGNSGVNITPGYAGTFTEALAWSDNSQAGGGGAGTGAGAGAGGSAATAGSYAISGLAGLGHLQNIGGHTGANGGAHTGTAGGNIGIQTTGIRCSGGAGGAGVQGADLAGGTVTFVANSYLNEQRQAAHAAGSVNGPGGNQVWKPFYGFGGSGGSSSNAGVGGHGGIGAIGCGGGGGGGGTTGGTGGNGGPGAVLFVSW
jgi:hypothetical protein